MLKVCNQKGVSLLEMTAVIIIGCLITSGIFGLFSSAMAKAKLVSSYSLPKSKSYEEITFGPYSIDQVFPEANKNAHIFLGDACINDFSCRRSFCGQIEIRKKDEVYVHIKNLTHCIKHLATY